MKQTLYLLLGALLLGAPARAQTAPEEPAGPWTLEQCIDYARRNNLDVRRCEVEIAQRETELSTERNSRLPDLNASLGTNIYFGRGPSRDGTYVDNTQLSGSLGVSASVPVFQGMRINRRIKGAKLDLAAATADCERMREDLAVRIMTFYLEVLFQKELTAVAEHQLDLSTRQAERSRLLVETGRNPVSARYESEALRAADELALTEARNALTLALLDLSQALNRPSAAGFDIAAPGADDLTPDTPLPAAGPDAIYDYAEAFRPAVRAERLRLAGSENALCTARSALWPSIMLGGGYGTNVYRTYATGAVNTNFWDQLRNNGNEYVGLSVQIPLFNRRATRNGIRSAALNVRSRELALAEAQQNLRKEIEQAWYGADAARMKFRSAAMALESARTAFRFEEERAEAGRSTLFDYNDARTRMLRAESELIRSKYEYLFRCKILDFYRGEPLAL